MIYVDEIAFVKPEHLFRVIMPMWQVDRACLISITSPCSFGHIVTQMSLATDDAGVPLIDVMYASAKCEMCKVTNSTEVCTHMPEQSTGHLSSRKRETLKKLMSSSDHEQEIKGIPAAGMIRRAFTDAHVISLFTTQVTTDQVLAPETGRILVMFDPSGGGASQIAVVSIGVFERRPHRTELYMVCCLDAQRRSISGGRSAVHVIAKLRKACMMVTHPL